MDQAALIFPDTPGHGRHAGAVGTRPAIRAALFGAWLTIVAILAAHHVFWRDEVRAFSLALSGGDLIDMARAVHGEGHPLLWYLLLRAAHMIVPVREVLPAVGLAIGIAGAGFFAWRAPFRPLMLAAVLFGGWMTFEYVVMARNYGISMLLMFVIADRFARGRDGALAMGGLLFALCNTNVPSVILSGGFLLFWLVEIVSTQGWRWSPALARWTGAAAIMLAGVVTCFLTVYPPFNEAAVSPLAATLTPLNALAAAINVGPPLSYLWPEMLWRMPGAAIALSLLVLAGVVGLARSPGASIAALVVLPMFLLFFQLVYPGSYRHQALYLCFLVSLRWMVAGGRGGRWSKSVVHQIGSTPRIAEWGFLALLLAQSAGTAMLLKEKAQGHVEGQSAQVAALLARPGLAHAIVMGVPDVMVEPLRYYVANPTYLLRQHRFGTVAHFTRHARQHLTLGGILATARALRATTGRPIVILMRHHVGRDADAHHWDEGILGDVDARPGESVAFNDATRLIATPVDLIVYGQFDEHYCVYVLKPPPPAAT